MRSGNFQEFDFGTPEQNEQAYGQTTPPQYDLKSLENRLADTKIQLYIGSTDALVSKNDLTKLLDALPANIEAFHVDDYNHLDYMWAKDANSKIYNQVKTFMAKL